MQPRCLILSLLFFQLSAQEWNFDPNTERDFEEVYAQIQDIRHPTYEELQQVQDYLKNGKRPYLEWILKFNPENKREIDNSYSLNRFRTFNIFKADGELDLSLHKVVCNTREDNLDRCIVMYSSFNHSSVEKYTQMLLEKIPYLKESGFRGHVLYRVGGWPNIEGGDLPLIHVPYSFKTCMIREAESLGYRNILWLDSSVWFKDNYDLIFDIIEGVGYYFVDLGYEFDDFSNERMEIGFNMTRGELKEIPTIAATIIGLSVKHPDGKALLDKWHQTALELDGFLSPRMDQQALAVVAYHLNLEPICNFSDVFTGKGSAKTQNPTFHILYEPSSSPPE